MIFTESGETGSDYQDPDWSQYQLESDSIFYNPNVSRRVLTQVHVSKNKFPSRKNVLKFQTLFSVTTDSSGMVGRDET